MNRRAFFSLVGAGFATALLPKPRESSLILLLEARMEAAGRRMRRTLDEALFTDGGHIYFSDGTHSELKAASFSASNFHSDNKTTYLAFDTASQTMLI